MPRQTISPRSNGDVDLGAALIASHGVELCLESFVQELGDEIACAGRARGAARGRLGGQAGTKRDPRLPDTPTLFELMDQYKSPEIARRLARIVLASGDFGRPMVIGPGTPPDRLRTLRDAYAKAMRDPGLIEEAKKGQMDMQYTPGEDLQTSMNEIMNQPREAMERVKKILAD